MEEDSDYISFKVVFDNQVLLLTYDKSLQDFKNQTIKSLIQEVLNNIGQKPLTKKPKDFKLHCPCGNIIEHSIPVSELKSDHSCLEDKTKEKNKNEAYLLIEKEEIKKVKEEFSKEEFEKILKKVLDKKKKAKNKNKIEKEEINKEHSKSKSPKVSISLKLKNKIKELKIKEERGKKIIERGNAIYYNEDFYKELLEMGINKNKAKASLRLKKNNKQDAALLSTENNFNWEDFEYLYYDNSEVLTKEKLDELCIEEIRKEYPFIKDKKEIMRRFKNIMYVLNGKKDMSKSDKKNEIINFSYEENEIETPE